MGGVSVIKSGAVPKRGSRAWAAHRSASDYIYVDRAKN